MLRKIDPAEVQLRYGIHSEWNVRELRIQNLWFGRKSVSWVFRDDGPVWNGRQRHPDIPVAFVLPEHLDWNAFKVQLWSWLEGVKKHLAN